MSFTVTIQNNSTARFPGGYISVTSANVRQRTVKVPPIASLKEAEVTVKCEPRVGLDILSVANADTIVLTDEAHKQVTAKTFTLGMKFHSSTLSSRAPPRESQIDCYNILLFGFAGAGKSAFLNTTLTLMSEEDEIVTRATTGGGGKHNTTTIRETLITPTCGIWDTYGLEAETYKGKELGMIFNGLIASGWKMTDFEKLELQASNILRASKDKEQRAPSACVFLVPASSLQLESADSPMLTDMKVSVPEPSRFRAHRPPPIRRSRLS